MAGFLFFFFLIVGSMVFMATFAYKKWVQAMEAWAAMATNSSRSPS